MPDLAQRVSAALAGRYTVERELGRGGMATVFLAEDLKHHRQVAIKVLDPEVAAAIGPERFLREIETVAALTHPHILPLFDSGQAGGLLFYVMPYVEGESLRDRLNREKELPLDDALRIAREVADALSYAHAHGLVHRDIKPENVLLEQGHAVVADFGIARAALAAGEQKLTATGIMVGTPAYMSPEQVAGSRELDGRSDLYSLGCVLYEMLAGQPPFTGPTAESVAHQHLNVTPRLITDLRPAVPAAVAAALQRALAKAPADRYRSVSEYLTALQASLSGTGSKESSGRPRAWSPRAVLVAGVAVAALAVAAGWFVSRSRHPRATTMARPEWVLMTDFEGPPDDPQIANAVRELVRTDLDQSSGLRSVPQEQVRMALAMAQRPESTRVTEAVAHELAVRNEFGSVLAGQVLRIGRGFSVVLRALDGERAALVTTLRQTAKDEDDLIPSVARLTRRLMRELEVKQGAIRATRPPAPAMTASFEAFKRYRRALDLQERLRVDESLPAAWEAVRLDPDFAQAWLVLGIYYTNSGMPDSAMYALGEAKKRESRLTAASRWELDASIALLRGDRAGALRDYDRMVEETPFDFLSQFNRGRVLEELGRFEEALQGYGRAEAAYPIGPPNILLNGIVTSNIGLLRLDEARSAIESMPDPHHGVHLLYITSAGDDWARTESLGVALARDESAVALYGRTADRFIATVLAARGRLREAAERLAAARITRDALYLGAVTRGLVPIPTVAPLRDTTVGALVTRGMLAATAGDLEGARRCAALIRTRPELERIGYGRAPALLEACIARQERRWPDVVAALAPLCARAGMQPNNMPYDGPGRTVCRWVVGQAYEELGRPDSAARYYEWALAPDGLQAGERLQRSYAFSYLHQRLVLLCARLGRREDAERHWQAFSSVFTRPDAEAKPLLDEARAAITSLRAMAPRRG